MAHEVVKRQRMSTESWARLMFSQVDLIIVEDTVPTCDWQVRTGQYMPEGYVWDDDFHPINEGDWWGRPDCVGQFEGVAVIPKSMVGKTVWLSVAVAGEVIVYANGKILDGLDPNRSRVKLSDSAKGGEVFNIRMEAYCRSYPDDERQPKTRHLRGCVQTFSVPNLIVVNDFNLGVKYDLEILCNAAYGKSVKPDVKAFLQRHIREIVKLFPPYESNRSELATAMPRVCEYIKKNIYDAKNSFGHEGKLACVGHSHLDIAYHWKASQSIQKNARTCLIQLRLMDRYPDFIYSHSQAWIYESLEKYYPELFNEVKERVAQGRWEIVGGFYVETDCNLLSAESYARQIIYGKRYFLEKFGVEIDNCWMPDVFGNSAIMPQILKAGGINYFLTNKMPTWNDTNPWLLNSFIWRGLDGSDVYACVPPSHFITWMEPDQVVQSWADFNNKDVCDETLHMYGYGDGGSGVTDEMLEYYHRLKKLPGMPEMRLCTGKDYFDTSFRNADCMPVHDGELYLEAHRGTLTTKAVLKAENRHGEFSAYETESLCTIAALKGTSYPNEKLRQAWKKLLLNQFHDTLPGSHTGPVFDEAMDTYQQMKDEFEQERTKALDFIAPKSGRDNLCVFNPFSFNRKSIAILDDSSDLEQNAYCVSDSDGRKYAAQWQVTADGAKKLAIATPELQCLSITDLKLQEQDVLTQSCNITATNRSLENRFYKLEIDDAGNVIRLSDKVRDREVIANGQVANQWQLFDDRPGQFEAWDIIDSFEDHMLELGAWESIEVVENGPLSAAIRMKRQFYQSRAEQIIRLYADIPRIDFETWVDWQEHNRLLKVNFPVKAKGSYYTTDTSAGALDRPNHKNTTWQQAQFEVCSHKWVNISEGLFGVALMNNCKYGCDVKGNQIRLSLLRSPIRPDTESDRGQHHFTYSIFTHSGNWQQSGLVEVAYDFNLPMIAHRGRKLKDGFKSVLQISNSAVHCQALKMDENGEGDVIVRIIELYGSHSKTEIKTDFAFKEAFLCDLLERPQHQIMTSDGPLQLELKPYQLCTICFKR